MYARMMIGEAISEDAIQECTAIYREHATPLTKEPGFLSSQLLIEYGGAMLITLTVWKDRETCLAYYRSRHYRQYVAGLQHLLVGDFVLKLFRCADETIPLITGTIHDKEAQP